MSELLSSYGWWILGLVLLALEAVLPGVYLLFFGIGALVVGTNALLFPSLGWQSEVVGFLVVSGVAIFLGHRWYGSKSETSNPEVLNRRTERLRGREAVLSEPISGGRGRVSIDDGWWTVEGPDLPAGSAVIVESAEGSVLRVRPKAPQAEA